MLIGSIGIPSFPVVDKDTSTPFPCQAKACGCRSAEACWRACCCHTNQQKIAWARENGVTPPSYVFAAAAAEEKAASTKSLPACCAAKKLQLAQATCVLDDRKPTSQPVVQVIKQNSPSKTWKLADVHEYRKCRGLAPLSIVLTQALATPANMVEMPLPVAHDWVCIASISGVSFRAAPIAPPPKLATL